MDNPFHVIESTELYKDGNITLHNDRVRLPEGIEREFSWITLRGGSLVLALDRERNACLIKEYKYATRMPSIEVIGGGINDGEAPLDAARRELREEAGLTAECWRPMGTVHPSPSHVDCTVHLFLATEVSTAERNPDPGEVLEILRVPLAQAVEMVLAGEITHAPSCALILKAHCGLQ